MPKCLICGKELVWINNLHLKVHGIKVEDYLEKYPDADLGIGKRVGTKDLPKGAKNRNDPLSHKITINTEKTEYISSVGKSEIEWFSVFKEKHNWSNRMALRALLTLWYENETTDIVKNMIIRVEGGDHLSAAVHINPAKRHREVMEDLLTDLEHAIKDEKDPTKKANQIKALGEAQKTALELEKKYQSQSDDRITKLVENRLMICRNILPKLVVEGNMYNLEAEMDE